MTQQTAVEWLIEMISPYITDEKANLFIEQAKQMEKEQLDKAYYQGQESKYIGGNVFEQYYNETYNK